MGKEQELLEASRTGNVLIIEKLLGGKPKNVLSQALSISFRRGLNPNCQDASGYTPLHHAVLNGHRDAVDYLLRFEASATVPDSRGSTPVHLAAWTGNLDIMRTLLAAGITITQLNEQNNDWDTSLHFACQYGHTKIVEVLLEYGVDPHVFNKKEETPLDLGTQYGRLEAVELLIRTKPEVLEKIPNTRSLLHLAARNGHHKVVKVLLDGGCDINKKLKSGTALHEAAMYGKVEVVSELLHYDPPINVHLTDDNGETAMDKIKRHSTIIASDIASLIVAHLKGKPLPLPEESRSPSLTSDHLHHFPTSPLDDSISPYDNLQNLGLPSNSPTTTHDRLSPGRLSLPVSSGSPNTSNDRLSPGRLNMSGSPMSSSPNMQKPKRPSLPVGSPSGATLAPPGANPGNYINMNFPTKVPPKKPARSSLGVILDKDSTEESVVVSTSASMYELGQSADNGKQPRHELAPPLPERNYYDEDLAGEYAELRLDGRPPAGQKSSLHPSKSMQPKLNPVDRNSDLYNTSISSSRSYHMRHSTSMHSTPQSYTIDNLYEDLSSALSGIPRSHSAFSCVVPTRRQPEQTEPSPRNSQHDSIEAELEDSQDGVDFYEYLSEATTGSGRKKNGHHKNVPSNNNSIDSSSIQSEVPSTPKDQMPVPPPRKHRHKTLPHSSAFRYSGVDSSDTPSTPHIYTPPPTPDHPPPSPHTALLGIHAKLIQQQIYPAEYRQAWSHDSGKFSNYRPPPDGNIGDSDSYDKPPHNTVSSSSRRLGSEDSPCGTDCSSETEILRPDESDPFAGLIYGSNRGSRNISLNQSQNAFSFSALEKAVANQDREGVMAGENGSHDGPDSVFEAPPRDAQRDVKDNDSSAMDENSEWAQIESIMASFGAGLVRESVYIQDFQKEFERMFDGPIKPLSIGGWLESLGIGQYENTLIANGFDNLDFMGGKILEEQDLTDMGIHDPLHRKIILDATKTLPMIKPMGSDKGSSPVPSSVSEWLRSLLLSDYIPNFLENGITSMDRARELWEVELENVLEVHMLGHRKRILASLGDQRHSWHSNNRSSVSSLNQDSDSSSPQQQPQQQQQEPQPKQDLPPLNLPAAGRQNHLPSTASEQSSSLDIDLFKDYSKEVTSPTARLRQNPPTQVSTNNRVHTRPVSEPPVSVGEQQQVASHNTGQVMQEQAPSHQQPREEEEGPSYQWMHQPEVLIKGCCNYTAFYLGSSLIKEPRGTESTLDACAKLRKSAAGLHKIPSITLAINYVGVKFIDSKSKMVITDHEICNISHVAQDADDLKTFAYITKDGEHERWYCHVFTVKTVDVATEIILTLGQAFEIAYQMLLKTQSSHRTSENSRHDESGLSSLSDDTKL